MNEPGPSAVPVRMVGPVVSGAVDGRRAAHDGPGEGRARRQGRRDDGEEGGDEGQGHEFEDVVEAFGPCGHTREVADQDGHDEETRSEDGLTPIRVGRSPIRPQDTS